MLYASAMFRRHAQGLALLCALVLAPSCATMRSSPRQKIPVTTQPAGATVTVRDPAGAVVARETTPGTLVVKRGAGYSNSLLKYSIRIL
jgi:hypothetical protein